MTESGVDNVSRTEIHKRYEFRGYIPSITRRYEISTDLLSQERFKFIQIIGKELNALSFYKCLTLKGSLSKGKILTKKNASSTNINFGCFLDYDRIINLSDKKLRSLCKKYGVEYELNSKLDDMSQEQYKYNIFPSDEITPAMYAKIRLVRDITEKLIRRQGKNYFNDQEMKPSIDPEISIISLDGPFSIYSTLTNYEKYRVEGDENERINTTRALSLPFGMIISGNLTSYMKVFFNKLKSFNNETAELKWQIVRKAIIDNERCGEVPSNIEAEFPRTIGEAIEIYASKPNLIKLLTSFVHALFGLKRQRNY